MTDDVTPHELDGADWTALASGDAELLGLWADGAVHALWRDGKLLRLVSTAVINGRYPALSPWRPVASLFERAIKDLFGYVAEGGADLRPWLDHGVWDQSAPLAARPGPRPPDTAFPYREVAEGLQIVTAGPVRPDLVEPAELRLAGAGEAVMEVEFRLGYAHKGSQALMRGRTPRAAARFAARLAGDATVAHGIAFARAAEAATGTPAPPRAHALRGIAAEIERIAVHLAVIGSIGLAARYPRLAAQSAPARERLLQAAQAAFGHRLMMDAVIPGGMASDIAGGGSVAIEGALAATEAVLPELHRLADAGSLAARLVGIGNVSAAEAVAASAGGVVGRASGRDFDLRAWPGYQPYEGVRVATRTAGDADARLQLRLAEIGESIRLARALLALPEGPVSVPLPMAGGEGLGWAESPRGDLWHWLRLDGGLIGASFARDPAWGHWPVLAAAMRHSALFDARVVERSIDPGCSGMDQ